MQTLGMNTHTKTVPVLLWFLVLYTSTGALEIRIPFCDICWLTVDERRQDTVT